MAASPRTQKAAGSAQKASGTTKKSTAGSARKASSTTQKSAAGSARKASGTTKKSAAGSARKASGTTKKSTAGSARKASGTTQKAAAGSARKATGTTQKTAAGSAQKAGGASKRSATGAKPKTAGSRQKAGTGSRQKASTGSRQRAGRSQPKKGIYVYGIIPADVELAAETPGVGDPPGQIRVVRSDGLAALVSEVDCSRPLGSPQDLVAHEQIVDATAAEVPVLPARFGAVMASEEEVAEDLLAANHDEFEDAIQELEGRAQFVVKGRYSEQAILAEILSENRQAGHLANKLRGADPDATRDARIKLGEIINGAVEVKRRKDTRALGDAMDGHCVASVVREPTHELDAVHVAFLVETDGESEMEQAVEDLARDWEGRIDVRLLGPMAAYDFVGSVLPEG
jgi:Gas vesicle synthesis protein GvpL/GvpF